MGRADREDYRRALRTLGSTDPIAEHLFGTEACLSCTRVVSTAVLLEGHCPACRRPRAVAVVIDEVEPVRVAAVYVDASWHDGVAGLAVVGALGEHSRSFECRSNVAAECEALLWAMRMARALDERVLVFRTDSQSALRQGLGSVPRGYEWVVEWVPRRRNRRADQLSRRARLSA